MEFTDHDFPATSGSIFPPGTVLRSNPGENSGFECDNLSWARPPHVVANPVFVSNGFSPEDVFQQQSIGICWMLSALIAITAHPHLLRHIIRTEDRPYDTYNGGPFLFQFHQQGVWREVAVDDRLPVNETGSGVSVVFSKSTNEREMWVALLEKAYAKLHCSYADLHGGFTSHAFRELSGALVHQYHQTHPGYTFHCNATRMYNMLSGGHGFYTACLPLTVHRVQRHHTGLLSMHYYAVISAHWTIHPGSSEEVMLVRVKNSYLGDGWNGTFNDHDPIWRSFTPDEKKRVGYRNDTDDGIFFMQLGDFCGGEASFAIIEEATLGPDFDTDGTVDEDYVERTFLIGNGSNARVEITPSQDSLFIVEASRTLIAPIPDPVYLGLYSSTEVNLSLVEESQHYHIEFVRFRALAATDYLVNGEYVRAQKKYVIAMIMEKYDLNKEVYLRIFSQHPFQAAVVKLQSSATAGTYPEIGKLPVFVALILWVIL